MLAEPLLVVARVAVALERLGVRYLVVGSLASSAYGIPRATQDVDLVAELDVQHVRDLAVDLRAEFHLDEGLIREAIRRQASFQAVHLATLFKADVFVRGGDPWSCGQMERGRVQEVNTGAGTAAIRFASPEDTLLHKLVSCRLRGGASDRQWADVLGVLTIQGSALDDAYLNVWAPTLAVADLLSRARRASRAL
jgi:hypothetical protein